MQAWIANHRGPFRFCVTRPHPRKEGVFASEWLVGEIDKDDVEAEAGALLTDPRDTITSIAVWSVREESFVGTFKLEARPALVGVGV